MAEYASMLLVSGLAAILFFGGWNGPIPIFHAIGWADSQGITEYLANLAGCINFLGKALLGVTIMIWVRWTLPRPRIDQVMTMCLKYCVPLAAICFVGVLTWQVVGLPSPNHWLPIAESAAGREPWTEQTDQNHQQDLPDAPETVLERGPVGDVVAEQMLVSSPATPVAVRQVGGAP